MQNARTPAVLLRPVASRASMRHRLKHNTMLAAVLASGLMVPHLLHAQTLPSGGQVVAGAADIANSGTAVTVTQTTDRAIIDWTNFSIGQSGEVSFNNGNGATLNRVTGANLSSIDGLLSATGSVYLINPNGVVIGKSGVVKVGGDFVAATLDIGNASFMAGGDLTFEGPSLASVVNLGQIGALGGDVALVAANVRNDGTVAAPNGTLGLLAGNRILMRDAAVDDGKFLVLSGGAGTSVTNTGNIEAATAELRAEGGNIYALAGNTEGVIRATGVSSHDGRIYLSAGAGSVEVSGSTLSATGTNDGGRIDVTGQTISVAADATLDASGKDTGGTVMVIADMASGQLDFHGTAVAKGDLAGGFVETSGHNVNFNGARIDTTGATSGTWLIDPEDLTVDAAAATTINTNLATSNVTLQTTATTASGPGTYTSSGSGDIIINSDISWSSNNTLTLDSYHSINVNANLTASGAGGVVLKTNNGGSGGDYYFAYGKSLSFTNTSGGGQSLNINSTAYTLLYSMSDLATMNASTGKFALAKSLDASGTSYTSANPVGAFSSGGIFTGLGHTIDNLNINRAGSANIALFGTNSGTIRDIGLAGGSVSGAGFVAGLVYSNSGTVANTWSSASVVSTSNVAGGLVAVNNSGATIRNSFTTGSVTNSFGSTGGLVGRNTGTITNSFSTATVTITSGSVNNIAGLVGWNQSGGTVSNSFATGQFTGGSTGLGGLVGQNQATVSNSYYDSGTTGRSDTGKGTARTTAQLQGTLPTGFSSSVWGTGTGLYPYLKSFFPNGVTAVSGTAYNSSSTAVASSTIALYSGGNLLGSSRSGANGYYYIPVAAGTIDGVSNFAGVTQILSGGSSVTGLSHSTNTLSSNNVAGLDVISGTLSYYTGSGNYSGYKAESVADTFGSTYYTSLLASLSSAPQKIDTSGSFSIDGAIDATGSITFKAGGDLTVDTDLTLSGTNAVTLQSAGNLYFNANVTVTGTNAVKLVTGGGSYDYSFLKGKSLSFTNTAGAGQSLTINGDAYSLLYTLSDLQGIDSGSGYYALANALDLSGTTFTNSVIGTADGVFTGLGHTISNLNINAATTDGIGLIGLNTGYVRDIGITGGTIYGRWYSGALVGENYGQIYNAYSTADMHVVFRSGGLVGVNYGLISKSHATGSVTSNGANGGVSDMGGLVGWNDTAGTISQSYATGTVTGTANTTGGLVAYNRGAISDSFATGGVFGNYYAGGLVGFSDSGTISNAYATGYVSAVTSGGGFAGYLSGTTITNGYWDTTSSGTSTGVGTTATSGTPTGLTRSVLQNGSLPTGFSSTIWATGSGLYPYLKSQFRTGMQSISGYTYSASGSLPAATVAVYVDGAQVGGTTAASGADGYYYLMATPGTVTGTTRIGITETTHNASAVTGAAFTDAPVLTSGQVTGFNVTAGQLTYTTSQAAYSSLMTGANTAFGSSRHSTLVSALDAATLKITASGAFSLDQAVSRSGSLLIQSGGDMTLASTGSITSTASGTAVTLAADGSFINNAGSGAVSAGNGRWLIYTQANGNSAGAATGNSFGSLNGKNFYNTAFNFSTGAFAATPNSGNRFVTGYAPTLTVTADTKSVTYNGSTQTNTYGLSGYLTGDQSADSLTGSVTGLTTSSKNAGAYALTASGTLVSDLNYTIAYGSAGTLTIDKAALTLAAGTDTKTYDTNATSTGTVTVTGLLGSDSVTGKSQVFDSQNAGARTLTVNGYTVNDGNSGGNYDVTTQTAAGTISKAALTIAAGTDTKTYDAGTTSAGTVTVTGLQGSDTVTGKSQIFDSQNAGSRTLTVNGYTVVDGNNGDNYTVSTQAAAGTIAKAGLTIAAGTDSKTYDAGTTSTGTVSVTGLKGSDTVTGATQSFDSKNAGSRTLTVNGYTVNDGNGGGNYSVTTQAVSGTIAKAALTIAAGTDSKTYDATTTSTGTATVSGLKGSDTVTGATQTFDSKNAGSRTLTVNGYTVNDGNNGGNYIVATQTASGDIAKANLTLTAGADSKTYDATTTSTGTVTVAGLKGSDTVSGTTQAFDSKNAGNRTLNVTGYTVNDGNSGGNYTVATQTASGAIAKAALTAALTGSTAKTYDATLSATLTADNYVLTGLKGSDTVALNNPTTGAYGDINTGTGKTVTASGLVLSGTDAGNYTVNDTASANIGSIAARKLTLTADVGAKNAGATDPALTYAITSGSLAGSDTLSGNLSRTAGEDPGTYDITQGSLAASSNYDVTFVKSAFTITAVALQNNPVINPVSNSATATSAPVIQTAPIGLSAPVDTASNTGPASTASGSSSEASSSTSSDDGETSDAGSAAGDGNQEATGPSVRSAGQTGTTCADGDGCANTPYPSNQFISNSISFAAGK